MIPNRGLCGLLQDIQKPPFARNELQSIFPTLMSHLVIIFPGRHLCRKICLLETRIPIPLEMICAKGFLVLTSLGLWSKLEGPINPIIREDVNCGAKT